MKEAVGTIPASLIYEMVEDQPVYYKGYKQFLNPKSQETGPIGSSFLQSLIISNLVLFINKHLGGRYIVLTNEVGLQLSKGTWRAADIALFEPGQINVSQASNKYINVSPKVVVEIDTKAEVAEISDTFSYYNEKTEQLLDFGVEKVIWIFTDSKKTLIATQKKEWALVDWSKDIKIIDGLEVNMEEVIHTIQGKMGDTTN
jgi:transposase